MEPVELPAATGGNGNLTYTLTPVLPSGLGFDPETRMLSGAPMEIGVPQAYEYVVTDSDPLNPDFATLIFFIEVIVSSTDKAVLKDILAAQGRSVLTGATNVIGQRFRASAAVPDHHDGTTAALNLFVGILAGSGMTDAGGVSPTAGNTTFGAMSAGGMQAVRPGLQQGENPGISNHRDGVRFGDAIKGRSLAFTLSPGSGASGFAKQIRWTLWSAADAQRFEGDSGGAGPIRWEHGFGLPWCRRTLD